MEAAADYSVTPKGLFQVLDTLTHARQPVMVWGPPGIGKSAVANQLADYQERLYKDVRALLLDPVDLRGIPWRDGTITRWAPPDFLPHGDGRFLVNLEELPAATPMVQASLYQLVLDRKIGEYELPEEAVVIACGNREQDRAVSNRMPTALANRFVHITLREDVPEWCQWALGSGLPPELVFFIQMRPELLMQFDAQSREHAFPSPRSWASVGKYLGNGRLTDQELETAIIRGAVGQGAAVELMAFLRIFRTLPHPKTVLDDPHGAPVPSDISTLIALCGSLCRYADDMTIDSITAYARRLEPELGEFLVQSATAWKPIGAIHSEAWIQMGVATIHRYTARLGLSRPRMASIGDVHCTPVVANGSTEPIGYCTACTYSADESLWRFGYCRIVCGLLCLCDLEEDSRTPVHGPAPIRVCDREYRSNGYCNLHLV